MVCLSDPDHYSTRQGDLGDQGFALLMSVSAGPRIVPGKCWGGGNINKYLLIDGALGFSGSLLLFSYLCRSP